MAIVKISSTNNITNLDKYVLDGEAHNQDITKLRNLYVGSHNLRTDYAGNYNSMYIASQNYAVRKMAGKSKKKTQGYHVIISFSDNDFPLPKNEKELNKQAKQAYQLVSDWMQKEFPKDAQYLIGIQRDGRGKKLHAHVALNSVLLSGKVVNTNQLSVSQKLTLGRSKNKHREVIKSDGLADRMQDYMADNFKKVTGRDYQRVTFVPNNLIKSNEYQLGAKSWKMELKQKLVEAVSHSSTLSDFITYAKSKLNINIKQRRSAIGVDENGKKQYRPAYTYYFTDSTGTDRRIRDFRYKKDGSVHGLGTDYTPDGLENIFNMQRQQQQQAQSQAQLQQLDDIDDLLDSAQDAQKGKVDNNGKKHVSNKQQSAKFKQGQELEYKPTAKIKSIKVKKQHKGYDTSRYEQQTAELEQRNQQETDRRNAEISRKLLNDEQQRKLDAEKRKKSKRLQRDNNRKAQRNNQWHELLARPEFADLDDSTGNIDKSNEHEQHDDGLER